MLETEPLKEIHMCNLIHYLNGGKGMIYRHKIGKIRKQRG
jgi:hypothetical protein